MTLPKDVQATLAEQLAHCDGADCICSAYGEHDCSCNADWTPAEVYRLRARLAAADALLQDVRDSYSAPPVLHARIQSHLHGAGDDIHD